MRLLELDLSSPLHFDQFEESLGPFHGVIAGEYLSCLPSELLILFDGFQGGSQFVILALGNPKIPDLVQDLLQVIIQQLEQV